MSKRRKCPYCRSWFTPHPRLQDRQKTCGQPACRQEHKRRYDQSWRGRHPDYFRGLYQQQKEAYGTRAGYKREYRQKNPDYVRRNAAYVRAYRQRQEQRSWPPVSPTSCDLLLSLTSQSASLRITRVSHTSSDIFVNVSQQEGFPKNKGVSPTSFNRPAGAGALT